MKHRNSTSMKHFDDNIYSRKRENASYSDLPLFASTDICKNKHKNNQNSKEAFKKVKPSISKRKAEILEILKKQRASLEDIALILKVEKNTISGRFSEMKRDGLIKVVGSNSNGFAVYEVV